MALSPQVIIRERDASSFPDTSSNTIIAIIGYGTKGPIGKAVTLSGRNAFESTFGSIPKNAPWGHIAAYKAFNQGTVIYYRVANGDAVASERVINNAHPAAGGYQAFTNGTIINYGEHLATTAYRFDLITDTANTVSYLSATGTSGATTLTLADTTGLAAGDIVTGPGIASGTTIATVDDATTLTLSAALTADVSGEVVFYAAAETPETVSITSPTVGDWELSAIVAAINSGITTTATTAATASLDSDGRVRITADSTGASSNLYIVPSDAGTAGSDLYALLSGTESPVVGTDVVLPSATDNILFRAKEKGSDTDKIAISKSTEFNSVEGRNVISIGVWFGGVEMETFEDVSLDPTDAAFFGTLINREPENFGSKYVEVEFDNTDGGDLAFPDGVYSFGEVTTSYEEAVVAGGGGDYTPTLDEYDYRLGNDGAPEYGGAGLYLDALASNSDLANAEKFNYHILITPDNGSQAVQNAAISLAQSRLDFLYLADPPFGLTYTEVVDWHNGAGYGRDAALNSSFAATYWPWLKDMNPRDDEYIWCPPSVFLGEKLLQVDRNYAPWYAPAGDLRGRLVASDTETSPSLNQRDFIYGKPNAVNPIVNFATKGIIIYGQKTTLRQNSVLNRVNVRRMAIYASKLIKSSMEGLIFEPHLPDSWARATDFVNRILEPIRRDNGLEDYQVTIDGTTNDADAIANGVMKGIIKLVPVNAIETVDLTITFLSPGVAIS